MKEVLDQALADMVAKATAGAEEAGSFIIGEIPEVAQQLIMFTTASTVFRLALCVLLLASLVRIVTKKYKEGRAVARQREHPDTLNPCLWGDTEADQNFWAGAGLSGFIGAILFLCSMNLSMTLFKLTLAPKVWLIEYAAKLVGG